MYTRYYYRSFIDSQFDKRIRLYVSVDQSVTRSIRQDTRRLRFSFFRLQCQTAGSISAPIRDRHSLAPVPLSGMPATWSADRVLNFHENVCAWCASRPSVIGVIGSGIAKCQARFWGFGENFSKHWKTSNKMKLWRWKNETFRASSWESFSIFEFGLRGRHQNVTKISLQPDLMLQIRTQSPCHG